MKKLLVLIFVLLAPSAWATDTCTFGTVDQIGNKLDGFGKYSVAVTCTADAGSNFEYTLTDANMNIFDGRYGYTISTRSNTVSDLAEFEVRDSIERTWFDGDGNGNDFLIQASSPANVEYFSGPNTDHSPIIDAQYPWTFYGENIGAAGGTINLVIEFLD